MGVFQLERLQYPPIDRIEGDDIDQKELLFVLCGIRPPNTFYFTLDSMLAGGYTVGLCRFRQIFAGGPACRKPG